MHELTMTLSRRPLRRGLRGRQRLGAGPSRVFQADEAHRRMLVRCLKREAKITAENASLFPNFAKPHLQVATDYDGRLGPTRQFVVRRVVGLHVRTLSHGLWDEMVPPPTRKIACRLTVTYAGFSGESLFLEGLYQARYGAASGRARPSCWQRFADVLVPRSRSRPGRPKDWLTECAVRCALIST